MGKGDGQLQIEAQIKYQLPVEWNLSCAATIAYIKEIDIANSENIENVV